MVVDDDAVIRISEAAILRKAGLKVGPQAQQVFVFGFALDVQGHVAGQ